MSTDDALTPDEQFTKWLAARDDALAGGAATPPLPEAGLPPEVQERLERETAWCRMVRDLLPRGGPPRRAGTAPPALPERLGRFVIRRELGHGAFGVVYLAYDPRLGREVALKVPRAEALFTPQLRARFRQEARAAAALDHPHLVPVFEAGEEGAVCYIASAYCPGVTLAAWLRQRAEPVAPALAARLVAALADAVDHAHGRGVLHRDLKPSNVMLETPAAPGGAPAGLDFVPRVTDFGLAKLLDAPAGADGEADCRTQTGAVLGTPCYMAPEQAAGNRSAVGPAADVYGLGALLYEVLTGRPPFLTDSPVDTLVLVRTEEPVPPSRLRPAVPRDLETICLKCLAKEPARRYAGAGALAADLRRWLAGEPIRARRVGPLGRAVLWCRRKPALASTLAAAVLAVAGVSLFSYGRVVAERNRYRLERDRAEGNLYRALVGETRAQMQGRDTGWWWKALDNLGAAARLDVAAREPAELRELAVQCMGAQYLCFRLHGAWEGHTGTVTALAMRADGRLLASGSRDRSVRLWSVPDGRTLAVLSGHTGTVTGLALDAGGRRLASCSADGSVRLWDLSPFTRPSSPPPPEGMAPARVFSLRAGMVRAVAFTPDGRRLVAACQDGTIRLIALAAEGPAPPRPTPPLLTLTGHTAAVTCLALGSSDKLFASGSDDRTIRFWDLATGRQMACWPVWSPPTTLSFGLPPPGKLFLPDQEILAWGDAESSTINWQGLSESTRNAHHMAHTAFVSQLRHLGNGRLLSASGDGTLKVWMRVAGETNGREAAVARGEWGAARSTAVSPQGGWVAAGYDDGRVRLWQLAEPPQRFFSPEGVYSAAFLGRARRLATRYGAFDFSAGLPPVLQDRGAAPVRGLAVHPAGRLFAFGQDDGSLRVWDLPGRSERARWQGHGRPVRALAGSPDGRRLASAAADGLVKVWDWETGRLVRTLEPDLGGLHAVAWSRDGRHLAATGQQGAALWDLDGAAPPRRVSEHALLAGAAAFGTDALALSGPDGAVLVFDLSSGRLRHTLRGHTATVAALEFSPDGRRLASGAPDGTVRLWDPAVGKEVGVLPVPGKKLLTFLAFDPRGRYLIANTPGTVFWDLRSRKAVAEVSAVTSPHWSGQFLADGSAVLVGTESGSVRLFSRAVIEQAWAAAGGSGQGAAPSGPVRVDVTTTVVPGGHDDTIWGVAASPDGRRIATASHDLTVKLWDARTLKMERTLTGHSNIVWSVAFSPDGNYLASGSAREGGGEVKVWETATGRPVHHFEGHQRLVVALAFHPERPWLASASLDGSVRLWDLSAGRPLGLLHQFDQPVHGLAFTPDGRRLVAACHNRRVAVWDVGEGLSLPAAPARLLAGHTSAVWSVAFSADGRYLASGAEQGVIILWDGLTLERVVTLRGGTGEIRSVSFSGDGQLLAGAAWGGHMIVWDLAHLRRSLREMALDWE
jgi:WD40 repeat protein